MQQQLTGLLCEFATTIGLPEPDKLAGGAPFRVNGFTFAFGEQSKKQHASILLFVDFGAIPDGNKAAVYYRLLRENYLEFPTRNGTYCVSSLTGNVVCARALSVATLSVDMLTVTVAQLAEQAIWWQREYADGREYVTPAPMRRPAFILPLRTRPSIVS
ncbi:CesT family type III secretion system chaperone [Actimicrobium antarcticum]|uniref:Uncharacterized protein n=1 Tax=Actimicrobium antarcticum TaxID=1051899 RepID=A0ABP7U2A3_9BURK